MFGLEFAPATNKNGFSKIRFIGVEEKSGTKIILNEKTGEHENFEWRIVNLIFDVMGVKSGEWKNINISTNGRYSDDSVLGTVLKNMGFVPSSYNSVIDEDGFRIIEGETDEDGFGIVEDSLADDIENFLKNNEGRFFIAKIFKPTEGRQKGFYQILPGTIELFKSKSK
jgi:hypothetical protein